MKETEDAAHDISLMFLLYHDHCNVRCGRANRIQKIVGGTTAEENEYPWQVKMVMIIILAR